jgi:outer membrane protein assembly factor BamB
VLCGDTVVVQCDVQDQSFVAALDAATGEDRWRTLRNENPTWCTPTVHERGKSGMQVLLNGYEHIGAYDLATGEELWKLSGGGDVPVPTPVVEHDLVFFTSAHGRLAPLYAVRIGAEGTLTADPEKCDALAWYHPRGGVYMQTPLVYGLELYACSDGGILACHDALTGEQVYRERLGDGKSGFSASGVASDGKLYYAAESGEVHVVRAGTTFESLAVNDLGETCLATPAVSRGQLVFRTVGHVVAVRSAEAE